MNVLDLVRSSVLFDERSHTYTAPDGRQLTGGQLSSSRCFSPTSTREYPKRCLPKQLSEAQLFTTNAKMSTSSVLECLQIPPAKKHTTTTS